MSCSVRGCKNTRRKHAEGISFHVFPKGALLNEWLRILNIEENWSWSRRKVVCSKHFQCSDFVIKQNVKFLKTDAAPSLFLHEQCREEVELSSISCEASASKDMSAAPVVNVSYSSSESSPSRAKTQRGQKRKLIIPTHTTTDTSTDSSGRRRRTRLIKKIHSYSTSPHNIKSKLIRQTLNQKTYKQQLYRAKKKIKSLKTEVDSLKTVTSYLTKNQLLSEGAVSHLKASYEDVPHLLMQRYLKNIKNSSITHETYPAPLRDFAATLQFYSCKGYEEVRKQFALALPHQATIRKWFSNIDCSPGFIEPSFEALKYKVQEAAASHRQILCSLMLDEMSIKKQIEFDGKKMWGYVDIGVPIENDELEPASEVLVVMVVAQQSHWKLPIAYFLIKSLTGQEKANIIRECLVRLHDVNVTITSLTCDGPSAHFSMLKELGCNFQDAHNMKTWFTHPCNEEEKVYCILDACHMLKLVRNSWAALKDIKDPDGNIISWSFIEKLHNLQEREGLYIANKLRKSHLDWHKQKMKVHLAAQTLSTSVAEALEVLDEKLKLQDFAGSLYTREFIYKVNNVFDILNSKSPWAKGYKAPMRMNNQDIWRPFLLNAVNYLLRCTDLTGRPLWLTPKKTPFIGFAVTCLSVCGIFDHFVKSGKLEYFLTYKCSQDHLEIFFCSIRSRNGWNNNPTCLQFVRTFRKVLLHARITGRGGNCKVLDTTTVLTVPSTNNKCTENIIDVAMCRKYNVEPADVHLAEHNYDVLPNFIDLGQVSLNVVVYISGYVIKMLEKTLKCMDCLCACTAAADSMEEDMAYTLVSHKNKGGLHIPSAGVTKICKTAEVMLRSLLHRTDNKLPNEINFVQTFVLAVSQTFYTSINTLFPELKDHFLDALPFEEHHGFLLIKQIVHCYTKIRIYNLAKKYTATIQGPQIRRELTKLILFNHQ